MSTANGPRETMYLPPHALSFDTESAACQAAFANQKRVGHTAAINRSALVHERMAAIKKPIGSIG